jgi:hypothetical protein
MDSIKQQLKKHNELLRKLKQPPNSNTNGNPNSNTNTSQSPGPAGAQANSTPAAQQPDTNSVPPLTRIQPQPADSTATPPAATRIQLPDQVADTQTSASFEPQTTAPQGNQ